MSEHVEWVNLAAHYVKPTCVVNGTHMPDGFQVDQPYGLVVESDADRMVVIEGTEESLLAFLTQMEIAVKRTIVLSRGVRG